MKRRPVPFLLGAALAAALSLAAGVARAEGEGEGDPKRWHGREAGLERLVEELGLEPAQRERVRAILESERGAREERRERMRAAYGEMRALLEQDAPDEEAVMRQVERIGELKTEKHKAILRTLLAVRAELTPEQRERLKERMRAGGGPRWLRERRARGSDGS